MEGRAWSIESCFFWHASKKRWHQWKKAGQGQCDSLGSAFLVQYCLTVVSPFSSIIHPANRKNSWGNVWECNNEEHDTEVLPPNSPNLKTDRVPVGCSEQTSSHVAIYRIYCWWCLVTHVLSMCWQLKPVKAGGFKVTTDNVRDIEPLIKIYMKHQHHVLAPCTPLINNHSI